MGVSALEVHFIETDLLSFFRLTHHTKTFSCVQNKAFRSHSASKLNVAFDGNIWNFPRFAINYFDAFFFSWPTKRDGMIFINKKLPGLDCLSTISISMIALLQQDNVL